MTMRYKDIWFAEYERQLIEAEDRAGRPLSKREEEYLAERARGDVNERLADQADVARKRAREEG